MTKPLFWLEEQTVLWRFFSNLTFMQWGNNLFWLVTRCTISNRLLEVQMSTFWSRLVSRTFQYRCLVWVLVWLTFSTWALVAFISSLTRPKACPAASASLAAFSYFCWFWNITLVIAYWDDSEEIYDDFEMILERFIIILFNTMNNTMNICVKNSNDLAGLNKINFWKVSSSFL